MLPPGTPGLARLARRTERTLLVTAAPGRTLYDDLAAAGLQADSTVDLGYYDFVASLRALVWSVAAVVLAVGLLGFALAAVDRAVTRRREVTALQLVGVPRAVLRWTQWIEAALPLALGCGLAIGLGLLAGAALIGGLTVLAASPRISADLIRRE